MQPIHSFSASAAVFFMSACAWGQQVTGLQLSLRPASVPMELKIENLTGAYRVNEQGDVEMLATAESTPVLTERIQIAIDRDGLLTVQRLNGTVKLRLAPDNTYRDGPHVTGLPFGIRFLPPGGAAAPGRTWSQEYPAPASANLRTSVTMKFTYSGVVERPGCRECHEIQMIGFRRFEPGPALEANLAKFPAPLRDPVDYTSSRPFAAGKAVFDRRTGFFHSVEFAANESMLTLTPVPGLMRRLTIERAAAR